MAVIEHQRFVNRDMALHPETIDDFCRLCAIESQAGTIIYSTEGESLCLEEKIMHCLRIEVSRSDMLPKKVCESCRLLLEDYHRFSERAAQVQQTLGFLLGLHMRHMQEQQEAELLLLADIKMESSMIKNELDELTVQQGSVHVERDKFEQEGLQTVLRKPQEEQLEEEDYSNSGTPGTGEDTPRHRRKMLQPKKTSNSEKPVQDEGHIEMEGIECLIESDVSQDDFKPVEFNENDLFQDLEDEDPSEAPRSSPTPGEEDEQVEVEWQRNFGILCTLCQSVFPHRAAFDKHSRLSHDARPVYTCSFCKKSVEKYSTYRSHIYRHIYEGRFKCKSCDKSFSMKNMLRIHHLTRHAAERPFICEQCGKGFVTQPRLEAHQRSHRQQHRCTECGKVLQTRGGLTAHMTVHKLGRRFMCDLCGKTFTQKINMQQHVKHHKGERPFCCDDCGKCFAEKSHLNRHRSFHSLDRPFQCTVCSKMYKTERCLKVHSQVHLHTRPYVCCDCGKGFLSSTKLKQHYNCHTGERPFACKYCERTFTNYPNWLKHTRRRHKVDHKTGVSLKEEAAAPAVSEEQGLHDLQGVQGVPGVQGVQGVMCTDTGGIEFIEMPEVEVKGEVPLPPAPPQSPHSLQLMSQALMAQFHVAQYQLQHVDTTSLSPLHYEHHVMPL